MFVPDNCAADKFEKDGKCLGKYIFVSPYWNICIRAAGIFMRGRREVGRDREVGGKEEERERVMFATSSSWIQMRWGHFSKECSQTPTHSQTILLGVRGL